MPWNSNVSDSLQTILTSCPQFQLSTQVWFSINPQCKLHLHAEIVVMTSRMLGIQRSLLPAWHGKYHYSLTGPSKFLIPGSFTASTDCEFQDFCYCWWDEDRWSTRWCVCFFEDRCHTHAQTLFQNRDCSMKTLHGPFFCPIYILLLQAAHSIIRSQWTCWENWTAYNLFPRTRQNCHWAKYTMLISTDIQYPCTKEQSKLVKIHFLVESALLPPLGATCLALFPCISWPDAKVIRVTVSCCRNFATLQRHRAILNWLLKLTDH